MSRGEHIAARPRTLKELCVIYSLSAQTMRRQILACGVPLRRREGRGDYYTIRELKIIVEALGEPGYDNGE